jgi:glycine cleavage system H lipoate-binding protein
MMGNLAMYATKGFEYLLILGFLALFTVFYLYLTSRRFEKVASAISRRVESLVDWFRIPDNILYHQGHTWVKRGEAETDVVLIGMDDFAQKLAGPMSFRNKPAIGSFIRQGERGWSLVSEEKSVDMLAPLSGEVVAVNPALLEEQEKDTNFGGILNADPYGNGWILKVKPENFERERKNLLAGTLARKWMEEAAKQLRLKMSPELGAVMQDGGVPIAGMAKNINADEWDQIMKEFFLT